MVKVGFWVNGTPNWIAGLHYLNNLVSALYSINERKVEVILLRDSSTSREVASIFGAHGEIVNQPFYSRFNFVRMAGKAEARVLGTNNILNLVLNKFISKNRIDVMAYSGTFGKNRPYKIINWIPDFQHLHLPGMFSKKELRGRNTKYRAAIDGSDIIILSSNAAYEDYKNFAPDDISKAQVMQFVALIDPSVYQRDITDLERKYGFHGKYFYLPNQFWKHKNHITVFEAVRRLKRDGKDVQVICTGRLSDYRNKGHVGELESFIGNNELGNNIKLLGLVKHSEVMTLLRYSVSLINPSLFEGWSTSVEEAKSLGKRVILSNIKVHLEQDPPCAAYFNPDDQDELAAILWNKWVKSKGGPDKDLEKTARKKMTRRTAAFAERFQDIIMESLGE